MDGRKGKRADEFPQNNLPTSTREQLAGSEREDGRQAAQASNIAIIDQDVPLEESEHAMPVYPHHLDIPMDVLQGG